MEVFSLIKMKLGIINFLRVEGATSFCVPILYPRVWRLTADVNMNQEVK